MATPSEYILFRSFHLNEDIISFEINMIILFEECSQERNHSHLLESLLVDWAVAHGLILVCILPSKKT